MFLLVFWACALACLLANVDFDTAFFICVFTAFLVSIFHEEEKE